jgi:hypothetical protein
MYEIDDIIYATDSTPLLKILEIEPKNDFKLFLRFNTGAEKVFDFKDLLNESAFKPLSNWEKFKNVKLDYGVPTWEDENVDISPAYLYEYAEK